MDLSFTVKIPEEDLKMDAISVPTVHAVEYIIRAKGIPFGVEASELAVFFAGCDIKGGKKNGIHFLRGPSGSTKGVAFVEFIDREDMEKALSCNKSYLGDRYIDIAQCTRQEMESALAEIVIQEVKNDSSKIVKVSGMPYVAMHDQVATFFAGCDIAGGKKQGIHFIMNEQGGPKGIAFVEFLTVEDTEQALKKDRDYMGNRYCQVHRSNEDELAAALAQMEAAKKDIEEPVMKLKGLPFKCTKFDIRQFFQDCTITEIELLLNEKGNCRGDAFVEFATIEDAQKAMNFSRKKMSHRHVDIYKSSRKEWTDLTPNNPKKNSDQDIDEPIVRIQGLAYRAEQEDVRGFFAGLETVAIQVVRDDQGDCRGEAFIEFKDIDSTMQALGRHKQSLGNRYIEVFPSSRCDWRSKPKPKFIPKQQMEAELYSSMTRIPFVSYGATTSDVKYEAGRKRSYDGMAYGEPQVATGEFVKSKDGYYYPADPAAVQYAVTPRAVTGYGAAREDERYSKKHSLGEEEYLVNMVGLPFSATKEDVVAFFHPLPCVNIQIIKNNDGKAKGIAVVGFHTEADRQEAMRKHKSTMGSRYINMYVRDRKRDEEPELKAEDRHGALGAVAAAYYGSTTYGRRAERSSESETRAAYPEYTQYY